jgi:isopenicillin N synthase-like dioxygenase
MEPAPGPLRLGAYRDNGSLAISHRDGAPGGLEVVRHRSWEKVPAVAASFVVDIGDLTARWTNDRGVPTLPCVPS